MTDHPRDTVYLELEAERMAQDRKWGEQNHPDGTGTPYNVRKAERARVLCDHLAAHGQVAWADIFYEEVCEALAESDTAALRAELLQVAAVAIAWVEAIDRRGGVQ